jgi:hypothetical protein
MEDVQRTYIHEDEIRGFYVNMSNAGTKSNGNGGGKEESRNLVETIKSLQRDVQSYKLHNERLMKAKEQQDGFNIKLLQSLDRIEKKMDKETKSSKSRSYRSHAKRGEFGSASRHHHHSPRHSMRRAHNIPSLSPIRKHKRRSRVDELQGEMNKIKPPTFDSDHKNDEDTETWLLGMRKYFQLHNYSSQEKRRIAIYQNVKKDFNT